MFVDMHMCACMCACVSMCVCVARVCMHAYVHLCVCAFKYVCLCACVYVRMHRPDILQVLFLRSHLFGVLFCFDLISESF